MNRTITVFVEVREDGAEPEVYAKRCETAQQLEHLLREGGRDLVADLRARESRNQHCGGPQ